MKTKNFPNRKKARRIIALDNLKKTVNQNRPLHLIEKEIAVLEERINKVGNAKIRTKKDRSDRAPLFRG